MHMRILPLLLVAVLIVTATSPILASPRPVQAEGELKIGWALGEFASIGEEKIIFFTGDLHNAIRGCNGLKLRLTGQWKLKMQLCVSRIELLEAPPALDEIVRLHGVLAVDGESFRIGETSFRATGPLVKALTKSDGVDLDLEATREGDALRVFSMEVPLPDYPWIEGGSPWSAGPRTTR